MKRLPFSFYLGIVDGLREGQYPAQIAEKLGVKKQNLTRPIKELKKAGVIEQVGYSVWNVNQDALRAFGERWQHRATAEKVKHQSSAYEPDTVRGHGWEFKLVLPRRLDQHARRRFLDANEIKWKTTGTPTWTGESFELHGWRVWFTPVSIRAWFPKTDSIYSDDAYEAFLEAVYRWKEEIVKKLERMMRVSFKKDKGYQFSVTAEQYALIKNAHAEQLRHDREKFYVRDENGTLWLITDFSHSEDEMETVAVGTAVEDSQKIKAFYNGIKKTGITPEFILEGFSKLQEDRHYYAENIRSHVAAIQSLDQGVKQLTKTVAKLQPASQSASQRQVAKNANLARWMA